MTTVETKEKIEEVTTSDFLGFTDCFAYGKHKTNDGASCSVLTEDLCKKKGKCSFYKTEKQFYDDMVAAEKRNREKRLEEEYDMIYEEAKRQNAS